MLLTFGKLVDYGPREAENDWRDGDLKWQCSGALLPPFLVYSFNVVCAQHHCCVWFLTLFKQQKSYGRVRVCDIWLIKDTKCVPISWSARQRTAFCRRYWFSDEFLMISVHRRSSGLNCLRCGPRHTIRALVINNIYLLVMSRVYVKSSPQTVKLS